MGYYSYKIVIYFMLYKLGYSSGVPILPYIVSCVKHMFTINNEDTIQCSYCYIN